MRILSTMFSVALVVIAGAFLYQIQALIPYSGDDAYFRQPNFFPIVTLIALICFGTALSIKFALGGNLPMDEELSGSKPNFHILVPLALAFTTYILMVPFTGYLLTTLVFGCVALLAGRHLNFRATLSMILLGLALYLVFVAYLDVWFPQASFSLESMIQ